MVRTKIEDGTDVIEGVVKTESKSKFTGSRVKEKSVTPSLVVDKPSFGIGFFIGSFLLCMFIIGCIVGSTVM